MEENKTETKPLNLSQRINKIMADVGWVEKRGKNSMQNYNYAQEADVTDMVRKAMIAHGVVVEVQYKNKEFSQLVYGNNKTAQFFQCEGHFTLINADDQADRQTCIIPGHALDSGDKAVWKCLTGIGKYFMMKTFMIPTGDDPTPTKADPEADEEVDTNLTESANPAIAYAEKAGISTKGKQIKIYCYRPAVEDHEACEAFKKMVANGRAEYYAHHPDSNESDVYVSKFKGASPIAQRSFIKEVTLIP